VMMKIICNIFAITSKKEILTWPVIDYITICAQGSMLTMS
jgi:hypothetical protein